MVDDVFLRAPTVVEVDEPFSLTLEPDVVRADGECLATVSIRALGEPAIDIVRGDAEVDLSRPSLDSFTALAEATGEARLAFTVATTHPCDGLCREVKEQVLTIRVADGEEDVVREQLSAALDGIGQTGPSRAGVRAKATQRRCNRSPVGPS